MKISILEPIGISSEQLQSIFYKRLTEEPEIVISENRPQNIGELERLVNGAEIVVIANMPFPKEVIMRCHKLRMISVAFTGVDHIDLDYCHSRGITVCNTPGYSTHAVSELVFGLALSLCRNIPQCDGLVRSGAYKSPMTGSELYGKKFGVIGMGEIGRRVADLAAAFGCDVYGYSRTIHEKSKAKYVPLEKLLSICDIVSIHVPLKRDTLGFIGMDQLRLMKPNSVIINTSRGGVIDSAALAELLKDGRIAGAGADVFDAEPPLDRKDPLLGAPNTVLTPHIAYSTIEALTTRAEIVADNIAAFIDRYPQNKCC